jgi:hypothetical protein
MSSAAVPILWAVSSVGKGHVVRDMAIARQLDALTEVEIDWIAPHPAGEFLERRGHRVLPCSSRLEGSGRAYERVFAECSQEFNLLDYIRAESKLHKRDFEVSSEAWAEKDYAVVVGDEAFWLLSGFASRWGEKPAPFVFLTDFIGIKVMRRRPKDLWTAWTSNLGFSMSHMGPDVYVYIGEADEIPSERFALLLPGRRRWAQEHCRFVKPIVGFDPSDVPDKRTLRRELKLPQEATLFLATIGPEGDHARRLQMIERVFEELRGDFPDAQFIAVSPEPGALPWIRYHRFIDRLHEYFAASDLVITQSGYGKMAELSALGTPFIAIPLDYHFEQEHFMRCRIDHHESGRLVTLRDHTPEQIAGIAREVMERQTPKLDVDSGREVAEIILVAAGVKPSTSTPIGDRIRPDEDDRGSCP